MRVCRMHFYAAYRLKALRVCKGYARYSCAMPTWIYAYDKPALFRVVIVLLVKLLHHRNRFRIIHIRIQHLKAIRQAACILQIPVKRYDFI